MSLLKDPRLNPLRWEDREFLGGLTAVLASLLMSVAVWHAWQERPLTQVTRLVSEPLEFRLDINQAAWPELALLPRIGEVIARRIVDFRDASGRFTSVGQLDHVKGIGPKVLDGIRPFIEPVGDGVPSSVGRIDAESTP